MQFGVGDGLEKHEGWDGWLRCITDTYHALCTTAIWSGSTMLEAGAHMHEMTFGTADTQHYMRRQRSRWQHPESAIDYGISTPQFPALHPANTEINARHDSLAGHNREDERPPRSGSASMFRPIMVKSTGSPQRRLWACCNLWGIWGMDHEYGSRNHHGYC